MGQHNFLVTRILRLMQSVYRNAIPPEIARIDRVALDRWWDGSCYFGASLAALEKLGRRKGYALVGCSVTGANAFFVREDELNGPDGTPRFHSPYTAAEHYEPPRYALAQLPAGHPSRIGANGAPVSQNDSRVEAPL